ncbi:MAG: O-antigen ligase family protein [Corynebacteriales bacterium]|nr:O-antigen ligase family protein [Mycobacteriales bacterium]
MMARAVRVALWALIGAVIAGAAGYFVAGQPEQRYEANATFYAKKRSPDVEFVSHNRSIVAEQTARQLNDAPAADGLRSDARQRDAKAHWRAGPGYGELSWHVEAKTPQDAQALAEEAFDLASRNAGTFVFPPDVRPGVLTVRDVSAPEAMFASSSRTVAGAALTGAVVAGAVVALAMFPTNATSRPTRVWPWEIAGLGLAAISGVGAALQIQDTEYVVPLAFVGFIAFVLASWWLSKGNVLVVVMLAYLLAPAPADNILPQVTIFPDSDYAVRSRDLLLLADLILIAALIYLRPGRPSRLLGYWMAALGLLACYPIVVGAFFGAGQSLEASFQGATMPLRAIGILWLTSAVVRRNGWDTTLRDGTRAAVAAGAVLAGGTVLAAIAARGALQFSVASYPLIVDGRPALPGWGNNILANYFCLAIALLIFARRLIDISIRWTVALVVILLIGISFTEVRIAMIVALLIAEIPIVLLLIRRLWPTQRAVKAVGAGALAAMVLGLVTVTALPVINPRFQTLTPGFISAQLPESRGGEEPERASSDPETGKDLGGESAGTRRTLAFAALEISQDNPILGTGWNGWGWDKSDANKELVVGIDPHNGFLWLQVDAGALGLILLYAIPLLAMRHRGYLWWLWAILATATALEAVNPNLRNARFAVVVWFLAALALLASEKPYPLRARISDSLAWLRGESSPTKPEVHSKEPV